MNTQQIKNLANRLCPKEACSKPMEFFIDDEMNELYACRSCKEYYTEAQLDTVLYDYEVDSLLEQDVDINLKELNNL